MKDSKADKRFFAFGCSFTHYPWPTWADIMAIEHEHYQNWGQGGGGNHFIFYSLVEAIERAKIDRQDTVAIMWTSPAREDRFVRSRWKTTGNVYGNAFPKEYIDRYADPTGYYLTSLFLVDAAAKLLESIGCTWHFFSMVQLDQIHDAASCDFFGHTRSSKIEIKAAELFAPTLRVIYPSVHEIIFANDWRSRDHVLIPHAQKHAFAQFKPRYQQCQGPEWPTFDAFINNDLQDINPGIVEELEQQFGFFSWRDRILTSRQDSHPIPSEHAEYLEAVGFTLSSRQKEFVQYWDHQVLNKPVLNYVRSSVTRF